ncbi:MAG: glycosyltransferase family 4 protein [Candidatus Moranbacteria bacterium]|nr:glycosyltransferase family 4 protein [Candidatus Moranbacteria bacterium]
MKKVLFLNYEYPPLGGGAANATLFILREYAKLDDLDVDLVTSSVDEKYHLEEISGNVRVHRLPIGKNESNLHFQSQKDLLVYTWKAYFFSKKLIKEKEYDLTHSFFTVPCGAVSWLLWMQYKIPYAISLRGSDVPGYSDRFGFIYKTLSFFIKHIWNKAEVVVSNSQGLKELAHKTDPEQEISVIYNGVDTEKFKPEFSKRDQDKILITMGGTRITHRKGIKHLIEAIDLLKDKYPDVVMEVMGEGNAKKELEDQVDELGLNDRVKFWGVTSKKEMPTCYQRADIFVLASFNEGMSNAMLEALAAGLPIVSTRTGGAEELLGDGENGYFIEKKNSKDLAEKLEKIISDKELRLQMGQKSREKALEMSWEKVAQKYDELYGQLVR